MINNKEQAMFYFMVIRPLEEIIDDLENKTINELNIDYLNDRLYRFVNLTAEILGVKLNYESNKRIEDKETFLEHFKAFYNYLSEIEIEN